MLAIVLKDRQGLFFACIDKWKWVGNLFLKFFLAVTVRGCVLWYCQWSQFIVRGYNSIRFETQKRAQIRPLISNIDVCTSQYKCWHILSIQIIPNTNIKIIAIHCQQLNSIRSQTQQNWKCTLTKITFDWCVSYQCWHCFVITIIVSCPTIRSLSLVVQQCNSNTISMNSLLQFIAFAFEKVAFDKETDCIMSTYESKFD